MRPITSRHPRLLGALVGFALLLSAIAGTGSGASADQIADKKAEAARIATQLDTEGNRVSLAAEHYNQARIKLDDVRSSLEKAKAELARADSRMQSARALLASAAVHAYMSGGSASLLGHLARSDNNDIVIRQQHLRFTAADQRGVLGQVKVAREDYAAVQGRLSAEERDAAAAARAAETARRSAADAESAQRALLGRVNGELTDMVAAESAARQAAQAAAPPAPRAAAPSSGAARGPAPGPAAAGSPAPKPVAVAPPPASGGAGAAVAEAMRQVGKPYVYGGSGPDSFDCSGLMMWAWRAGGVSLSHSAQSQYFETTRVPTNALQPGDILFFGSSVSNIGHDAMYIGNGQMVEAPHTGLDVRVVGAFRSDLLAAGRPG